MPLHRLVADASSPSPTPPSPGPDLDHDPSAMPRPRRPPGAGPALTLLALLLLPSILVAAQQQQPLEDALVESAPAIHQARGADVQRRRSLAPLVAQDKHAVATKVSPAPAITAVRAHPGNNAASGALLPSARSLQDWEIEDFVLLATVDGHIHARDRYNGKEIWELAGKPMLETIYNVSEGKPSLQDQPFIWIVEPREDGALYVLTPGPFPVLQSLGLTVKQLTDIAPYSSDDPDLPVVWNVEKKTFMLLVDAASGVVKQGFSPGRTFANDDSCAPESKNFFSAHERDCRGIIDIGQTEYTITIHNKKTNEHLCTIKYAEWNPNSRDKDLQLQYAETMDKHYVYSTHNGVVAYDHKRPKWHQRPLFEQLLPYPVARVFDVARPTHDESAEPPLVLLPQPVGPAYSEDMANRVLLNTTDTGAWYALSEVNYPTVTHLAPPATCYTHNDLLDWDAPFFLPDQKSLVGVHVLEYKADGRQPGVRAIAAPTYYPNEEGQVISHSPKTSLMEGQAGEQAILDPLPPPQTFIESKSFPRYWVASFLTFVIIASLASYKRPAGTEIVTSYLSRWTQSSKVKEPFVPPAATTQSEPESFEGKQTQSPSVEAVVPIQSEKSVEEPTIDTSVLQDAKEKKVTFNIPEDDEDDLSPISRTTTADPASTTEDEQETVGTVANGETRPVANVAEDGTQDPAAGPGTPKKKKTHRGKRGGRKLNRNQAKDDDEVGRIVDAAKQLEVGPRLHPDEVTMNGDDIQDVSNIKRIGKLTIDQDRLLGNGSGGTFVFEGKWNVSALHG